VGLRLIRRHQLHDGIRHVVGCAHRCETGGQSSVGLQRLGVSVSGGGDLREAARRSRSRKQIVSHPVEMAGIAGNP
jgi:hypothetical protein